jgi:hypothetical protein
MSNHPVDGDQPLAFLLSTPAVSTTFDLTLVRELISLRSGNQLRLLPQLGVIPQMGEVGKLWQRSAADVSD